MKRKYGISFSWKRAVGISGIKNKISRNLGIPLTRSGRQRKVGRLMGCLVAIINVIIISSFFMLAFTYWII